MKLPDELMRYTKNYLDESYRMSIHEAIVRDLAKYVSERGFIFIAIDMLNRYDLAHDRPINWNPNAVPEVDDAMKAMRGK